jgi:type IV pilus assembly protein PilW
MKWWRPMDGLSLVELLISLAVGGLLLAAAFGILRSGLFTFGWAIARIDAQQSARVGLDRMARELREAGYDPTHAGIAPIVVAAPDRVVLQSDLNGNGVVDPTRERVTFVLRGGESILRRDAGGGAQPIIDGVRRLTLTYFDQAGAPTTNAGAVAAIRIALEVGSKGPVAVMETAVSIRNRSAR